MMYQYFVKIVPTVYVKGDGEVHATHNMHTLTNYSSTLTLTNTSTQTNTNTLRLTHTDTSTHTKSHNYANISELSLTVCHLSTSSSKQHFTAHEYSTLLWFLIVMFVYLE